jgi:hypothetical protein
MTYSKRVSPDLSIIHLNLQSKGVSMNALQRAAARNPITKEKAEVNFFTSGMMKFVYAALIFCTGTTLLSLAADRFSKKV